jgi:hypothetical protein
VRNQELLREHSVRSWVCRMLMLFSAMMGVVALPFPPALHAPEYSGTILETVSDSTGAAIPDCMVRRRFASEE